MYYAFGDRLKRVRKTLGLTQEKFAEGLGIKRGGQTISDWERGSHPPGSSALQLIVQKYSINQQWLLDGVGEMFSTHDFEVREPNPAEYQSSQTPIHDLLKKTGEILQSNTIYRTALTSNINAFHQSILVERDMKAMEAHMNILEQQMQKLTQRMDSHPPGEQPTDGTRMERLERKISELTQECDELKKVLGRSESEQDGSYPRTPLNDTDKVSTSPDAEKR